MGDLGSLTLLFYIEVQCETGPPFAEAKSDGAPKKKIRFQAECFPKWSISENTYSPSKHVSQFLTAIIAGARPEHVAIVVLFVVVLQATTETQYAHDGIALKWKKSESSVRLYFTVLSAPTYYINNYEIYL